jgi:hypothetical protein
MKYHGLLVIYFLVLNFQLFSQSFQWVRSFGDIGRDVGRAVCTDNQGNVIVAGYFQGDIKLGNVTYYGRGLDDIFLIKYDAEGKLLWAKTAGGPLADGAYGVATDKDGNIYIAGQFDSLVYFDNKVVFSNGKTDVFLAKYSASGQIIWVEKAGGPQSDGATAVAVDKEGSAYITGKFENFAAFGSRVINSAGFLDIFFAKYHADGSLVWIKRAGGIKEDAGLGIAVDTFGNCYATGYFNETANFEVEILSTPSTSAEIFIVKIDSVGEYEWAHQAGGLRGDVAYAIAVDEARNSYITGYFSDVAYFGQHTLQVVAYNDIFVAKYNAKGICQWARSAGGRLLDIGTGISVAKDGSIYITGVVDSVVFFENDTVFISRKDDTFVAKWDRNGNYQWVRLAGGPNSQIGMAICAGRQQDVYFTGYYYATIDFTDTVLVQQQDADIFLAKLYDPFMSGIEKTQYAAEIKVYPNPCLKNFYLSSNAFSNRSVYVTITNLSGKTVIDALFNFSPEGNIIFDASEWSEGLYFIKTMTEHHTAASRMVILK